MSGFLQKLGKSLMMPIAIIAAAGIFLGLSAALQNEAIVGAGFIELQGVQNFIGFIRRLVGLMFGNLPILFTLSVAIGMAKDEKHIAAFCALIGFLVFHVTISYILEIQGITAATTNVAYLMSEHGYTLLEAHAVAARYETVLGIFSFRTGILGGIFVGMLVSWLHNRFYTIQLPTAINFFGGKRFVPIITLVTLPFLGVLMFFVWPIINGGVVLIGDGIYHTGIFGPFLFGFTERILIPTGLHHILNQFIRFTPVGGYAMIDGNMYVGGLNMFWALLAQSDPNMEYMRMSTRFLAQGNIPIMMFGLPAAAYAILKTSRFEHKKRVIGIVSAAALTSFTTGITEPIEFLFIFISPLLFLFHAFMSGLAYFLVGVMGVSIGNVQGGVIDLFIFGILQGSQTRWFLAVFVGLAFAPIYFFTFKYVIEKKNLPTLGREVDFDIIEEGYTIEITNDLGNKIVKALGGKTNIKEVDNCFSRLRLVLESVEKIDEVALKETGAAGLFKIDQKHLQVVYGTQVEKIALEVKKSIK